MYLFYTLLYSLGIFLYAPRALLRGRRLSSIRQRLGRVPTALLDCRGAIWIHAVSVGEVHAARALLPALRRRFPGRPVVLSTTTPTGQELARSADADAVFFMPLDLPAALSPFLEAIRPFAVLLVETEIWPQLIRQCGRRGVPVVLVNARLSPRSFRRYRTLSRWWPAPLRGLGGVCARTRVEAERFAALGIDATRIWVTGNLKAEAAALRPPTSATEALRSAFALDGEAMVLVAGCTMAGEDSIVLDAFERARERLPALRLLIAPRHPERFDEVAGLVRARGLSLHRRTDAATSGGPADVLLLDTIGELPAAYALGTLSFVGGSLVPTGGHNLLEPAVQRQPVLHGPHVDNFAALAEAFRGAGAAIEVEDGTALADTVAALGDDPERRRRLGDRAAQLAERDAGAAERTVRRIAGLIGGSS